MELKPGYKQTAVGMIPADWDIRSLEEIADQKSPICYGIVQVGQFCASGIEVLAIKNLNTDYSANVHRASPKVEAPYSRSRVQGGDVLISVKGTTGRIGRAPDYFRGNISRDIARLRPSADEHGPFWHQMLQSELGQTALGLATVGTTRMELSIGILKRVRVVRPPLHEQRAIAAALSDVDALIAALDRLIAKKRDLKQAAMQQLLTGQTRLLGFASKREFKDSECGPIPSDWIVAPLLSALRIANGQVDPRHEPYRSMVLVAPDHIQSASGRLLARETASAQGAISGKYLFAKGDVIYSKIRPYLRKAVVADFEGLCSADMYPMRPSEGVSARFALAVILGHRFSKFAESVSVRSGMPKINRSELAEFSFPLPPAKEQEAIAAVLSDMDAEITALEARRDKTRLLKQGMMQELLTGRTRLV